MAVPTLDLEGMRKTNSIWKLQQIAERVQNNPFDSQ